MKSKFTYNIYGAEMKGFVYLTGVLGENSCMLKLLSLLRGDVKEESKVACPRRKNNETEMYP